MRRCIAWVLALVFVFATPLATTAAEQKNPLAELINAVELKPVNPQSEALNNYLDELMPQLLDYEKMDTYTQVMTCFDYVRDNTRYGSHIANLNAKIGNTTCRAINRSYGAVEGFGAVALVAHVGMCNAYASAFILMARKLGLDAYLVKGETRGAGGGYVYHEWAEIKIDETVYVFDPQLDQSLKRAGLPAHSVFFKTYDQVKGRYIKY